MKREREVTPLVLLSEYMEDRQHSFPATLLATDEHYYGCIGRGTAVDVYHAIHDDGCYFAVVRNVYAAEEMVTHDEDGSQFVEHVTPRCATLDAVRGHLIAWLSVSDAPIWLARTVVQLAKARRE